MTVAQEVQRAIWDIGGLIASCFSLSAKTSLSKILTQVALCWSVYKTQCNRKVLYNNRSIYHVKFVLSTTEKQEKVLELSKS